MIFVEGLSFLEGWNYAVEILREEEVSEWLLNRAECAVHSEILRDAMPFDFLRRDLGPVADVRETVEFRRSLLTRSFTSGGRCFGYFLKYEDGNVQRLRLVTTYDPETGNGLALIGVPLEDGSVVVRATMVLKEVGFARSEAFVAIAGPGSANFKIIETMRIDRDCDFCIFRKEPCMCSYSMKRRGQQFRLTTSSTKQLQPKTTTDVWTQLRRVILCMNGDAWLRVGDGNILRTTTAVEESVVFERIQYLFFSLQSPISASIISSANSEQNLHSFSSQEAPMEALPSPVPAKRGPIIEEISEKPIIEEIIEEPIIEEIIEEPKPKKKGAKGKDKKKPKCETCGSTFSAMFHLNRHIRTVHLREKRYACTQCNQKFTQSGHLSQHLSVVHGSRDKLECPDCNAKFRWRANYLRHTRKHHSLPADQAS